MNYEIKKYLKTVIVTALYFNSQFIYAQSAYVQDTQQQMLNTQLAYEKCPLVDDTYYSYDTGTRVASTRKIEDPACVARNREKTRVRNQANAGYNLAQEMNSGNSDGITKPTPPPAPNCGTENDSATGRFNYSYYSCMSQYNAQMREYQLRMTAYNTAVNEQTRSAQSADAKNQEEYANLKDKTATGSLDEIEKTNGKGKSMYTAAAAIAVGIAVAKYSKGAACAGSCPTGCCGAVPGLMAAGAAFMLINGMSNKQASQHAQSAYSACTAYNQLSTDKKDCSASGQAAPITISSIDLSTGKCKPEAPVECQQGLDNSGFKVPPALLTNGKVNAMASDVQKMATVLPDGRVKDKTGKIWSMADFADKKSMMAAGLSAADANSLFNELYGPNGAMVKSGLNVKDALKEESKKTAIASFSPQSGGGVNIVDITKSGAEANKLYKEKLNVVNPDLERKPSSEGLAREFNGEMIGVSGDDIFVMMNRRYKFKNDQDTFISAEAHK